LRFDGGVGAVLAAIKHPRDVAAWLGLCARGDCIAGHATSAIIPGALGLSGYSQFLNDMSKLRNIPKDTPLRKWPNNLNDLLEIIITRESDHV
jgi:hypothetical protein